MTQALLDSLMKIGGVSKYIPLHRDANAKPQQMWMKLLVSLLDRGAFPEPWVQEHYGVKRAHTYVAYKVSSFHRSWPYLSLPNLNTFAPAH